MSTTVNSWGDLNWDDPELRRNRLVDSWSKKPEVFKQRVIRPRPSRLLKYIGTFIILLGCPGWMPGVFIYICVRYEHTRWFQHPKMLTWTGAPVIIGYWGAYLALMVAGFWVWGKGANRKR